LKSKTSGKIKRNEKGTNTKRCPGSAVTTRKGKDGKLVEVKEAIKRVVSLSFEAKKGEIGQRKQA